MQGIGGGVGVALFWRGYALFGEGGGGLVCCWCMGLFLSVHFVGIFFLAKGDQTHPCPATGPQLLLFLATERCLWSTDELLSVSCIADACVQFAWNRLLPEAWRLLVQRGGGGGGGICHTGGGGYKSHTLHHVYIVCISLWDIQFFTFFQTFLNFWSNAPKCRHLGGGYVYAFRNL